MTANPYAVIAAHHRCCEDPEVHACEPRCDGSLCECGDEWPCDVRIVADELAHARCLLADARADIADLRRALGEEHSTVNVIDSCSTCALLARTARYTTEDQ